MSGHEDEAASGKSRRRDRPKQGDRRRSVRHLGAPRSWSPTCGGSRSATSCMTPNRRASNSVVYQIVRGVSVRYPAAGRSQQRGRRDAMAAVDKLGGNWIIVRSHATVAPDEIGGASESEENSRHRRTANSGPAMAGPASMVSPGTSPRRKKPKPISRITGTRWDDWATVHEAMFLQRVACRRRQTRCRDFA